MSSKYVLSVPKLPARKDNYKEEELIISEILKLFVGQLTNLSITWSRYLSHDKWLAYACFFKNMIITFLNILKICSNKEISATILIVKECQLLS